MQIFNLVWQMADLEARSAFAGRDKRRSPSMYVRSCELAEIFRRDKTTLFAGVELLRVPLLSLFLFFLSFLRIANFSFSLSIVFRTRSNVVSIAYLAIPHPGEEERFISDDT